jgi:N-acetylglucosamine kinase-like BadF-type ATPase
MSNKKLVIGVDGGGSKTAIACVDVTKLKTNDDAVVGTALSGCTNWNSVGVDVAKQNLFQGINEAITNANASWKDGTPLPLIYTCVQP